jgi:hypothetical protein
VLRALLPIGLLGLTLASTAYAACLKDAKGEVFCGAGPCARDQRGDVYCAPLRFGSAFRTRDGWVYCGRGQCLMTLDGRYICSDVEGGSVVKLVDGTVRCEGSCEYASWQLCERVPAGR